jgi:glycosyltransferase involved in cell wall biosynthesis
LAALLAPHHVGLIHGATWNPVVTFLGKALKVPVAVSQHQFYPTEAGAALGAADAIHCSSLRYARDWEQAMQRPVRRIVCPVEQVFFDSFASNLRWHRQQGTALRLLVSGTLQRRKNQLEAIRAIGLLVQQGLDVTLDLIGYDELVPDYVEACRQEIISLGLQDRVTIHGFTDRPERFYQDHCQILLMPSTSESMPQTVLQAMAAGLLVVTTDVGGVGEIIRHRYGGIIAQGTDAADLAEAVGLAASLSKDQVEEMLQHAHRTMELIGREEYVRAELIDLYNEAFENSQFGERAGASNVPMSVTIVNRSRELGSLQARVLLLETSLSYRVTAPLRALARHLRPVAWLANLVRSRR